MSLSGTCSWNCTFDCANWLFYTCAQLQKNKWKTLCAKMKYLKNTFLSK